MNSCYSFIIFFFIYLSLSYCVCTPKGTSCTQGYTMSCTDGTIYCDHMDLYAGLHELTNACIAENGGVTPKIRFLQKDIDLNLEKGVYDWNDPFTMAGNSSVHLLGDYRIDRYWIFDIWGYDNTVYFENETLFDDNIWKINFYTGHTRDVILWFNKQATFSNFSLTVVDGSKIEFHENVKCEMGSTLNYLPTTSFKSYKLFECENSNIIIDSIGLLNLSQTHIKSSSKWIIEGINTNSYCQNTIEVSNSNVTFEDNSIMKCCFNANDINSQFVIGNGVTCCLSRYESEKNIIIGTGNKITVDEFVIKNENDIANMNQFIPKGYCLYNSVSVTIDSSSTLKPNQTVELHDNSELIINGISITLQELKCNGNGIVKVINGSKVIIYSTLPNTINFYDSCQLIVENSTLSFMSSINFYNTSSITLQESTLGFTVYVIGINLFGESYAVIKNTLYPIHPQFAHYLFLFSTHDDSELIFLNGYQSNGIISNQQWDNSFVTIEDNCEVELTTIYYQDIDTNLDIGLNSNLKLEYLTLEGIEIVFVDYISDYYNIDQLTYKGYYLIGDYELNVNKINEYGFIGGEGNVNVSIESDLECYFRTNNKTTIVVNGSIITNSKYSFLNYTDISFTNDASLYSNNYLYLYNSIISFEDSDLGGNSFIYLSNSSVIFKGNCQIEGSPRISFGSLPAIITIKDNTIINKNCLGVTGNGCTIIIGNYSYVYLCSLDYDYWNNIEIGTDSLLRLKTLPLLSNYLTPTETSIDYEIDSLILPNNIQINKPLNEEIETNLKTTSYTKPSILKYSTNGIIYNINQSPHNKIYLLNATNIYSNSNILLTTNIGGFYVESNNPIYYSYTQNNITSTINSYLFITQFTNKQFLLFSKAGFIESETCNFLLFNSSSSTCIGKLSLCDVGYFYINKTCYSCLTHCKFCFNETICERCDDGYILNSTNQCENKETNCYYSNGINCVICKPGYYLENGKCNECSNTNCSRCDYKEQCKLKHKIRTDLFIQQNISLFA